MRYIVIVGVVGLVVACLFFLSRNRNPEPELSGTLSASESPESTRDAYKLIVLADSVSLKHGRSNQVVRGTVSVVQGDEVTTSATGRARLSWPNGTITTIEEDSHVIITELSDGGAKSRIDLLLGDIWSKVSRILGSGEYYEVQTQETVAAVRGTVFRTTYRNHKTRVQGIESVVRVSVKKSDGSIDDASGIDVTEDVQTDLDATTAVRRFQTRRLTATELKDRILERIRRERNLNDTDVLRIISASTPSQAPKPTPIPSQTPKPTITPLKTSTPTPTQTPKPTPTPTPSVTVSIDPTPTPTPAPVPAVTLNSAVPNPVASGATFLLEGTNFEDSRHISRFLSVSVGGQPALDFAVFIGGTQANVQPAQLSPGTYDIVVTTKDGQTATLTGGITIQ